jgi:hypothetical protein
VLTSYPDGKVTVELLQLTEDSSIDRKVVDSVANQRLPSEVGIIDQQVDRPQPGSSFGTCEVSNVQNATGDDSTTTPSSAPRDAAELLSRVEDAGGVLNASELVLASPSWAGTCERSYTGRGGTPSSRCSWSSS